MAILREETNLNYADKFQSIVKNPHPKISRSSDFKLICQIVYRKENYRTCQKGCTRTKNTIIVSVQSS